MWHDEWVLADLGSGKDCSLVLASTYPFKRVVGGEHAPLLRRCLAGEPAKPAGKMNCLDPEVVAGDALGYLLPEDDHLFVYCSTPSRRSSSPGCVDWLATAPLAGKGRMRCFVQQPRIWATRIDLGRLIKTTQPVALRPRAFDCFSHSQLETFLFDVYTTL